MLPSSDATPLRPDEVLETVRVFDAPRALVFRIWTEPEHRVRWWGPEGHALAHCSVDLRVGGRWAIAMQRVDGYQHWVRGEFREIEEPSRLAFTYVNDDDGVETVVTLDFIERGDKTEMRFRQAPFRDVATRDGHAWGWGSSMELLTLYVRRVMIAGGVPVGQPRMDGVEADIAAARERWKAEQEAASRPGKNPKEERGAAER